MLDAGANVNGIDWQGRSVLIKAARRKEDPSAVSILLTHSANVEVKDNNGMTAHFSVLLCLIKPLLHHFFSSITGQPLMFKICGVIQLL